jgi:hypothetical protein
MSPEPGNSNEAVAVAGASHRAAGGVEGVSLGTTGSQ